MLNSIDSPFSEKNGKAETEEIIVKKIKRLQVILKTVERCNLACTYCYYFFGGDESYKGRPPVIHLNTIHGIADFLLNGCRDLSIDLLEIIFHGGEPMLQKASDFDEMCKIFRTKISNLQINLRFAIQTNATLITPQWLELFEKHDVSIGISIDGPKEYNDRYRIDIKKRGSYDAVERGVKLLFEARERGILSRSAGSITVLNTEFDYRKVYRHLVENLKINNLSFLLPDISYDSGFLPGENAAVYGKILCEIFDAWLEYPSSSVRNIDEILRFFQVSNATRVLPELALQPQAGNKIIVIQSDGTVSVDDSLIPASKWRNELPRLNVIDNTLMQFFEQPFFSKIDMAQSSIPTDCESCCWKELCKGGDVENRFSSVNGFDNKSIYCDGLKMFYQHIVEYIVTNGFPVDLVEQKLFPKSNIVIGDQES